MTDAPRPKINLRTIPVEDQEARVIRAQAERDARKSAEAKRAEFEMKVAVTERLTGRLPRAGMADVFFAAARRIGMELLLGNVPIRNGTEAGNAINSLMAAGRAESSLAGDVDPATLPPVTQEEAERRLKLLEDEIGRRRQQKQQAAGE